MKEINYPKIIIWISILPTVIFGLIISGSFFKSAIAANGKPQFATIEIHEYSFVEFKSKFFYLVPRNAIHRNRIE
jgi:hypothetical protein